MIIKSIFAKLADALKGGGVFVWRREFAALIAAMEERSGVTLSDHAARETGDGLDFTRGGDTTTIAWEVTGVPYLYSVGPGTVRVAGMPTFYILSLPEMEIAEAGWFCVRARARPRLIAGSYASGLNNGFTGEVEIEPGNEPEIVFINEADAALIGYCEPNFETVSLDYASIYAPLAFVDPENGQIIQIERDGLLLSFGIVSNPANMGPDVQIRAV